MISTIFYNFLPFILCFIEPFRQLKVIVTKAFITRLRRIQTFKNQFDDKVLGDWRQKKIIKLQQIKPQIKKINDCCAIQVHDFFNASMWKERETEKNWISNYSLLDTFACFVIPESWENLNVARTKRSRNCYIRCDRSSRSILFVHFHVQDQGCVKYGIERSTLIDSKMLQPEEMLVTFINAIK